MSQSDHPLLIIGDFSLFTFTDSRYLSVTHILNSMFDIEFYHIILGYVYCLYTKKVFHYVVFDLFDH